MNILTLPGTTIVLPLVHRNGSSKEHLKEVNAAAYSAVYEATLALGKAAPNERDYYLQSAGAYKIALQQHEARMKTLRDLRAELMSIYEAIDEQGTRS